ncbi:MAG: hydrogenase formation protein HypD [Synergistaceae bacterium]|nr:hydrogenase formation protein HypD [Synergistaceae bacterium]
MRSDISLIVDGLHRLNTRPLSVMEVCGTHTVAIFRSGIRSLLPPDLRLVSGPGCPVCVTDQGEIDGALSLVEKGALVATYGDMLKVPCDRGSLASKRSEGYDVAIITNAMDVLALAEKHPDREVVFLAVGFETTSPATAALVKAASQKDISNLSVLSFHKRTPPVLTVLAGDPELKISGFLLPGHVCVILGHDPFRFLSRDCGLPSVIAGFEPEQILLGLAEILRQTARGESSLASVYGRAVRPEGNEKARRLLDEVFVVRDAPWRGIGVIPGSGYALAQKYESFDAEKRFSLSIQPGHSLPGCRCGDVLTGKITPPECPLFRTACTPLSPVGPCMVSSEGTCGAYFRFYKGDS